jgi:hypothetical protein
MSRSRTSYGGKRNIKAYVNRTMRAKYPNYYAKKNANKQVNAMLNNVRPAPYNASPNMMPKSNSSSSNSSNLSQFNNPLFQAKPNAKLNGMANSLAAQNEKTVNAAAATEEAASQATAAAEEAAEPSFLNKMLGTPAEQKNAIQVINNANNKAKNMAKLANNAAKVAANAAKIANSLKAKVSAIGGSRRTRRHKN